MSTPTVDSVLMELESSLWHLSQTLEELSTLGRPALMEAAECTRVALEVVQRERMRPEVRP